MTNASQGLWEVLPPMRFFQFPMRFLGPTALVLSPLAGTALAWVGNINGNPRAPRAAALMVAALFLSALPLTYPPPWSDFGAINRGRVVQAEISGKWLGTTCCNDFLPRGVESIPVPSAELLPRIPQETASSRAQRKSCCPRAPASYAAQHFAKRCAGYHNAQRFQTQAAPLLFSGLDGNVGWQAG
ncbi:hypothetical protein EMGBS1_07170 [Chloroflexota bacterium]|nr:hypothetical protein EMGBS1_07170 [Chloroflexota bacterium]